MEAGWYPDPEKGNYRYWTGSAWSGHEAVEDLGSYMPTENIVDISATQENSPSYTPKRVAEPLQGDPDQLGSESRAANILSPELASFDPSEYSAVRAPVAPSSSTSNTIVKPHYPYSYLLENVGVTEPFYREPWYSKYLSHYWWQNLLGAVFFSMIIAAISHSLLGVIFFSIATGAVFGAIIRNHTYLLDNKKPQPPFDLLVNNPELTGACSLGTIALIVAPVIMLLP